MNWNWQAIGAIAELASALAVLATLVYVAIQIRAMRATTMVELFGRVTDDNSRRAELDISHVDLILKANAGEELTEKERFILGRVYLSHASFWFHQFVMVRETASTTALAGYAPARGFGEFLVAHPAFMELYRQYDYRNSPDPNIQEFGVAVDSGLRELSHA